MGPLQTPGSCVGAGQEWVSKRAEGGSAQRCRHRMTGARGPGQADGPFLGGPHQSLPPRLTPRCLTACVRLQGIQGTGILIPAMQRRRRAITEAWGIALGNRRSGLFPSPERAGFLASVSQDNFALTGLAIHQPNGKPRPLAWAPVIPPPHPGAAVRWACIHPLFARHGLVPSYFRMNTRNSSSEPNACLGNWTSQQKPAWRWHPPDRRELAATRASGSAGLGRVEPTLNLLPALPAVVPAPACRITPFVGIVRKRDPAAAALETSVPGPPDSAGPVIQPHTSSLHRNLQQLALTLWFPTVPNRVRAARPKSRAGFAREDPLRTADRPVPGVLPVPGLLQLIDSFYYISLGHRFPTKGSVRCVFFAVAGTKSVSFGEAGPLSARPFPPSGGLGLFPYRCPSLTSRTGSPTTAIDILDGGGSPAAAVFPRSHPPPSGRA
jgi:hypothetical protein